MMEWTDRHCRYFHRLLTRRALLYTEMLTTGAVLRGDRARLLGFDPFEQPVALQLGGSAADLRRVAFMFSRRVKRARGTAVRDRLRQLSGFELRPGFEPEVEVFWLCHLHHRAVLEFGIAIFLLFCLREAVFCRG
jgi:hypothetical protein